MYNHVDKWAELIDNVDIYAVKGEIKKNTNNTLFLCAENAEKKGSFMLNYLEISKTALKHNARTVCEYVKCPVIGVVKCDGYGIGVAEAAKVWKEQGVKMFGVSEYHEALELREAGFTEDILLLVPVGDKETLLKMLKANVILTVSGEENARFYSENCEGMPVRVHVAVDTGMGRFGAKWTDIDQFLRIYSTFNFKFEGIFSHFSAGGDGGTIGADYRSVTECVRIKEYLFFCLLCSLGHR